MPCLVATGVGEQLRRTLALAVLLAEPALRLRAGRLLECGDRAGDLGLLLRLGHLGGDHAVARHAVADELVLPSLELLDQEGIAPGGHRVDRDAGTDLVAVEHVHHPEDAGTIAVFALRPGAEIGHVVAELVDQARVLVAVLARQQLEVFEMQHHAEGDARVARPGELGPLGEGRVVVQGMVHAGLERRRVLRHRLGRGGHVTPPCRDAAGRS